jgi:excisionase family DNA binding protein
VASANLRCDDEPTPELLEVRAPNSIVRRSKGNHRMGSMALNELGKMLTAAEVAEMLHLHVNTVKRLGDRGELKYYRVCKRGDRRFLLEDVRRFLDQNR